MKYNEADMAYIRITQIRPVRAETEGFFSNCRIDSDSVPDGRFLYEIREGEDGNFATIEPSVIVNHAGTVVLNDPLTFPEGKASLELLNFDETNADTADADYTF